jgi:cyclopropane fatty-acyl-phospholipid synthase-like methyltransferase
VSCKYGRWKDVTDWEKYWTTRPKTVDKKDYLKQVGKTVKGQPITDLQFQLIVSQISDHLHLKKDDLVLDLCCGNGLITKELAKKCGEVVGVDFSQPLLEVANRDHRPSNVVYKHRNVLVLDKVSPKAGDFFNKILMYEALQHFTKRDLITILRNTLRLVSKSCIMLFGSVPDARKKWKFYNTPNRRLIYMVRRMTGREAIGTWWDKEFIRGVCKQLDLLCEFKEQPKELYTSHYRFDVLISRINT